MVIIFQIQEQQTGLLIANQRTFHPRRCWVVIKIRFGKISCRVSIKGGLYLLSISYCFKYTPISAYPSSDFNSCTINRGKSIWLFYGYIYPYHRVFSQCAVSNCCGKRFKSFVGRSFSELFSVKQSSSCQGIMTCLC